MGREGKVGMESRVGREGKVGMESRVGRVVRSLSCGRKI